ncbi:MAG: hypothetical protein GXX96_04020 [Planctomycetaceae bacterium]|nr:hypothetical protein [Planctomycetaceae bacterium]
MLESIIQRCQPGGSAPVTEIVRLFRETYPNQKRKWPRSRILADLTARGYKLAVDQMGRQRVVGLSLPVEVSVVDGRIVA